MLFRSDRHLVFDRARLLLADLGIQQVADDLLRLVLALGPRERSIPVFISPPWRSRRDVCCAVRGRALAGELVAEGADVWECTHLGGHRFAPTALVLPTGYAYGRLDTGGALAALKAAAGGGVDPWGCRGHTGLDPVRQLAELAVREHTGIGDAAALLVDAVDGPGDVTVRSRDGRVWTVPVVLDTLLPPRPPSCGAALEAATPLVEKLMSLKGQNIVIDASKVERLGTQCVQILIAAAATWKDRSIPARRRSSSKTR